MCNNIVNKKCFEAGEDVALWVTPRHLVVVLEQEVKSIRDEGVPQRFCWEREGPLVSLSYNDLSYYLKYCYLYLSIFLEDGLLEKEKIIRLWLAEGFVQPKKDKTMEEVAADYLSDQPKSKVAERNIDGSKSISYPRPATRLYYFKVRRTQHCNCIQWRGYSMA